MKPSSDPIFELVLPFSRRKRRNYGSAWVSISDGAKRLECAELPPSAVLLRRTGAPAFRLYKKRRQAGRTPNASRHPKPIPHFHCRAFSLLEIMVAVTVLVIIMIGLLAMFYQTQRAFRSGATQSDVLDGGRTTMELITRDLQELYPTRVRGVTNFAAVDAAPSLVQPLPGGDTRSNVLQEATFITRVNDQWVGNVLLVDDSDLGVGTLWRLTTNSANVVDLNRYLNEAAGRARTFNLSEFHRVTDGVIHFRLEAGDPDADHDGMDDDWELAYFGNLSQDANGDYERDVLREMGAPGQDGDGVTYFNLQEFLAGTNPTNINSFGPINTNRPPITDTNFVLRDGFLSFPLNGLPDGYVFMNNRLPPYVDVELGILEPKTLANFRARTNNPAAASAYLQRQVGRVHLFKQRVPIRANPRIIGA